MMTLAQYLETHYKTKGIHHLIKRYTDYQNGQAATAELASILQYIAYLRKGGVHPKTLRNHLFAIKIYYRYLQYIGQREDHPCVKLTLKDPVNRAIATEKLYTKSELDALQANYQCKDKRLETRNKVILSLLINQALQVQEISALSLENIDLDKAEIYIAKTSKTHGRTLPLQATQIALLLRYLSERMQFKPKTSHFIISKYGKTLQGQGISRLLNEGRSKADRIQPIKIRQSAIALLLKSGGNLRLVQAFSGHKHSSSTQAYKQSELEQLQASVNKYHPLQ
ncbi:tyrosine-type recombinase/integrase [Myroides fluvii]|uniref:tyrosine-type recombinase/integrase n=1 Tax=Myroides fluvii TaxID=2572594 RepID=UPI00131E6EC3|nr:tyrosine-type recombinase/integrase [Myroides fluvii]